MVTGMNRWYTQLFKQVKANPDLAKLKLSEETFSENYQGDFAVSDAIPDLEVLATINQKNRAQARLVKISRDPKNYSIKLYTLKDSIPLSQSMPVFESGQRRNYLQRRYRENTALLQPAFREHLVPAQRERCL
jgi:NAD-specific glutamate dehydrogenase